MLVLAVSENQPVDSRVMGATVEPYIEVIVEMSEIWNDKDNGFHILNGGFANYRIVKIKIIFRNYFT